MDDIDGQKDYTISGRFVVDKHLTRQQIYENGDLIENIAALKTAPTSLFVLNLRNHKLMFAKEFSGAPGISAFRTTVQRLFNDRRNTYIREVYENLKEQYDLGILNSLTTLKSLQESISGAHIEIISLSGQRNLQGFLRKFDTLKEIRVDVIKTNAELDNSELFEDFRTLKSEVGAQRATMVLANSEGMDKNYASKHVLPAITGNIKVSLAGNGTDGKTLRGNEDDFKVTVAMELPVQRRKMVKVLLSSFRDLVKQGLLSVAKSDESQKNVAKLEKLREI